MIASRRLLAMPLVVVALASATAQAAPSSPEEVVRAYAEAANHHDVDALLALYAPGVRKYGFPATPGSEGRESNRAKYVRNFAENPDRFFDLITVDGDHSEAGARADLETVIPRLKVGGALVFDDISNPSHPELAQVWRDVVERRPSYSTFAFTELGFGVGVAIRHE